MIQMLGWAVVLILLLVLILQRKDRGPAEKAFLDQLLLSANRSLNLADVLNNALESGIRLLQMDGGVVHLLDKNNKSLTLFLQKGLPNQLREKINILPDDPSFSLAGRALYEKKAIFLEDISEDDSTIKQVAMSDGIKSAVCIPLFAHDEPVATLLFNSRRRIRFSRNKMEFLTSLGRTLGLAVANAQLYQQVLEEKQRISVINEITKKINSSLDFQEIYTSFAAKVRQLVDYDHCLIVLPVKSAQKLLIFQLAATRETKLHEGMVIPLKDTAYEWVKNNKKPLVQADLQKERYFYEDHILCQDGLRSTVRVPIWAKGQMSGLLVLSSQKPDNYSEKDLEVLEPIAEHLSLSLEKYFLFKKVSALSLTDDLTGCGNRRMMEQEIQREIKRADRYGRNLGILMLDLDHFKQVNDTHGHLIGDHVLKKFAELIKNNIRDIDICIRYGGEEFIVILPETDLDGTVSTAEKIRLTVEKNTFCECRIANPQWLTVSIGIAVYPIHASSAEEMIRCADAALYQAKAVGRNHCYIYEEGVIQIPSLFKM